MPGIYGYIKQSIDDKQIENMSKELFYQNNFIQDNTFSNDYLEFSHIHIGNIKKNNNYFLQDGIYISIEGEQYDFSNISFEEFLFNAYKNNCLKEKLHDLDGYFNAIIYDSNINKVFLVSDRYGMQMLYYYFKDGNFAWSGEVKGLLGLNFVNKTISKESFDCFIDLGYLLEDNTWFKNIKLIKPATIMEFNLNTKKLSQKYYWKWSEIKPSNLSFDQAVDKVGSIFIDAVKKRFNPNDKIGIALSGGLDSRAIFAAINKLYPNFKGLATTFGIDGCDDIEIAKLVISKTNWEHQVFHFTSNNWFEPRLKQNWKTDGMLNIMHMHGIELLQELKNKNFTIGGAIGDIVLRFSSLQNKTNCYNKKIDNNIAKIFYKGYSSNEWLNDDFYDINNSEPFLLMNDGRRFSNMGIVNSSSYVGYRYPFLDNQLLEIIYSLPDEYREGNKLYKEMLLKKFPDFFKDIPWQNTRRNLDGTESKYLNKDNVIRGYLNYAGAIREKSILAEIFKILDYEKSYYKNFTNINAIETYLKPHLDSMQVNHIEKIFRFITAELYLRDVNAKTK